MPIANEGTTALGDSGSPLLVKRNGEFLIAGVLSGGTTENSLFVISHGGSAVNRIGRLLSNEAGGLSAHLNLRHR
ncbi:MAG: hypothetical protein AAF215_34150 [Cyanobacteria bacterium P01_A01_bin.123]